MKYLKELVAKGYKDLDKWKENNVTFLPGCTDVEIEKDGKAKIAVPQRPAPVTFPSWR